MKIRLIIYIVITLICAGLFAFVPAFNWIGHRKLSYFNQFAAQGDIMTFLLYVFGLSIIIFLSLVFLFGLSSKKSQQE